MAGTLLRIGDLEAGYGDLQVLWSVNFRIDVGECVAVVGANGVGKSTLLKVIAGVLPVMRGAVVFDDTDITTMKAAARVRRGISLVPEGKRLFAGMTVRENLMMGAFARADAPEVAGDFDRVLDLFPTLGERLDQVAGTMSGGEQQMCSVGRALMSRPRLLLVDELSFGLSPLMADRLFQALAAINREGMTIVLVEQDVLAALGQAVRGYVIAGGRVVREGTSGELAADRTIKKSYLGG